MKNLTVLKFRFKSVLQDPIIARSDARGYQDDCVLFQTPSTVATDSETFANTVNKTAFCTLIAYDMLCKIHL